MSPFYNVFIMSFTLLVLNLFFSKEKSFCLFTGSFIIITAVSQTARDLLFHLCSLALDIQGVSHLSYLVGGFL